MDQTLLEVRVTKKTLEADDIASFELKNCDGSSLPHFSAGSHVDVNMANGLVRQYSLCNVPGETDRYLIAVLRDPNTRGGSAFMHDRVQQGDTLTISQPRNLFALARDARRSILFAGGIGVTPILAMAERLAQIDAPFELHYCGRSRSRTAFLDRISSSHFSKQAHFHFDDGPEEQRLDVNAILASPSADTHLYACGPSGFLDFVLGAASQLGWSGSCVHREYFAAAATTSAEDQSFEVELASSGQTFHIPPDKTVLEILAANGIDIPVSCEQGICGTCVTRVLRGEPDHRDLFMTDQEHAANDQFTPCCSRARSLRLVLDL
ncbi:MULTISPECIES: PDR/VanB family oxidoreductase [Sphingobium]|uniref:Vanillate monooxygenase oxidoreductase subunit n=3 Tax=Sphingobium TaxID=165695 RepID=D4Z908_SPHIU|nr:MULTISPECIES: PDR/VanB family oxidoreductase [Sphingobium]AMK20744.1 vanillate monooxygenase oxidoreductase subunit [Sphingobium sp. MI1205]EPR19085.1 Vanillate O-demethylase oxidoreductase [Sphingobium indicum IP26]EQB08400.1 Vanillate O-demethylase oxidoreductase [Sphingobium sp. HDIP04]BAI99090.1 vanillate monooxygenase oxidoreductase subunit [Sphingobium indicum UT26S]